MKWRIVRKPLVGLLLAAALAAGLLGRPELGVALRALAEALPVAAEVKPSVSSSSPPIPAPLAPTA